MRLWKYFKRRMISLIYNRYNISIVFLTLISQLLSFFTWKINHQDCKTLMIWSVVFQKQSKKISVEKGQGYFFGLNGNLSSSNFLRMTKWCIYTEHLQIDDRFSVWVEGLGRIVVRAVLDLPEERDNKICKNNNILGCLDWVMSV